MPKPPARPRLPIKPQILRGLKSQWSPLAADQDYVMLWAACCVGFLGFLRAEEFTLTAGHFDPSSALTVQDVSVDQHANPSMVRLHLKQSKTDPFRHGVGVCHSFKPFALTSSIINYNYVSCHKESLMHASLCFETYLNNIINYYYYRCKEHNKLLLRSITLIAKSSKKNERRQVNEKFYKLER